MNEQQAQLAVKPNPAPGGPMPGTESFLDLTALVPKDISDLLPAFLTNRRADVARLSAALAEENWAQVRVVAERMYALGNPYGFRQITTFGRLMRTACAQRNAAELQRLVGAYSEYLSSVIVVVVETSLFPDRKKHPAPA